ncbi:MAG: GAF domain-containing protein, partial [Candidatus Hydrogenedentes bacterium]|nr:GAF domain-containing protein [Candidatus Hydrogenedentota bacterium]
MNVLLIVAEDRAVCESLRAAVSETDLVLVEPTVEEALRRLIAIKADAVIVDDAPGLGRHAVARLAESLSGTPLLALSSRDDPEARAALNLAGARAVLVKPFSCDDLRNTLSQATREPGTGFPPAPARGVATPSAASVSRHQTALRWLSRTGSQIGDPAAICRSLVDALTDIFDCVRCGVLVQQGETFRLAASQGLPPGLADSIRLTCSAGLMRGFETSPGLTERATHPDPEAAKEMQVLSARLAVPLLRGGRVSGAIVLGDKASGGDYGSDERELLTTVARCAGISFENAHLYSGMARQQSRLDAVLANITAGVVVVSPQKTISMMNQSAERILHLRAVDVLGRSVQKLGSGFADI